MDIHTASRTAWLRAGLLSVVTVLAGCVTEEQTAEDAEIIRDFAAMSYGEANFHYSTAISLSRRCVWVDMKPVQSDVSEIVVQKAKPTITHDLSVRRVSDEHAVVKVEMVEVERRNRNLAEREFRERRGLTGDQKGNACDVARAEIREGTPIGRLLQ